MCCVEGKDCCSKSNVESCFWPPVTPSTSTKRHAMTKASCDELNYCIQVSTRALTEVRPTAPACHPGEVLGEDFHRREDLHRGLRDRLDHQGRQVLQVRPGRLEGPWGSAAAGELGGKGCLHQSCSEIGPTRGEHASFQ